MTDHVFATPSRYYLTGNSCVHQGYNDYKWPPEWDVHISGSDTCTPTSFEKFWYANHSRTHRRHTSPSLTNLHFIFISRNCAEVSISPKQKSSLADSIAESVNKPGGRTKPGKLNTGSNNDSIAESVNKPGGRIKPEKLNTGSNKPKKDKAPCKEKKSPGGKRRPKDKDRECDKSKPIRQSNKTGIRHKIHNRLKMVPH